MLGASHQHILGEVSHLSEGVQVQLSLMDSVLRKQWRLGQNIVLCWAPDPRGLLTLVVPHYFLGNFAVAAGETERHENEAFVRGGFVSSYRPCC